MYSNLDHLAMRTKILLVSILIGFLFCTYNTSAKEKFGIRGGIQAAQTLNAGNRIGNPFTSYYFGFYKIHTFAGIEIVSLNGGLEYMQNGWVLNDMDYRKINYLSVPFFIRVKIRHIYIQTGINANLKIREEYSIMGTDVLNSNNKYPIFDVPAQIGIGYKILKFSFEARYHHGLLDMGSGNTNSYLQLGIGFHL